MKWISYITKGTNVTILNHGYFEQIFNSYRLQIYIPKFKIVFKKAKIIDIMFPSSLCFKFQILSTGKTYFVFAFELFGFGFGIDHNNLL